MKLAKSKIELLAHMGIFPNSGSPSWAAVKELVSNYHGRDTWKTTGLLEFGNLFYVP